MGLCKATKRNGEGCTLPANGSQGLCWAHDPANAERRREGAKRGGKAKANKEITAIKAQLQTLADRIISREVDRADAAVCGQLLNVKLRALEQERKQKETDELIDRVAALEQSHIQKGRKAWG